GDATGHLLRERLRPAQPEVHEARDDDLSRGRARPPLPDLAGDGEPEAQRVPPPRSAHHRRGVRGGLGPLLGAARGRDGSVPHGGDRKSTRLNSSHVSISYAVFCLKKKNTNKRSTI